MTCPCILTAEFMTRNGALHAAKMHLDRTKDVGDWSGQDWLLHIHEEDRIWRPFLAEVFPLLCVVYDEDHRVFKEEIRQWGRIMSVDRVHAHSQLEEWATARFIEMGY